MPSPRDFCRASDEGLYRGTPQPPRCLDPTRPTRRHAPRTDTADARRHSCPSLRRSAAPLSLWIALPWPLLGRPRQRGSTFALPCGSVGVPALRQDSQVRVPPPPRTPVLPRTHADGKLHRAAGPFVGCWCGLAPASGIARKTRGFSRRVTLIFRHADAQRLAWSRSTPRDGGCWSRGPLPGPSRAVGLASRTVDSDRDFSRMPPLETPHCMNTQALSRVSRVFLEA